MMWLLCMVFSVSIFMLPLSGINKNKQLSFFAQKYLLLIPLLYWVILLGMQYYVGSDYPTYYKYFSGENVSMYFNRGEIFSYFIFLIVPRLNLPAQTGFFIFSAVQCIFFSIFLQQNKFKRLDLFLLIYFCCATAFVNQTNALRQYAAMNIFLFSIVFIYKRKLFPFLLLLCIACGFHLSALFLLPFYFLNPIFKLNSNKFYYIMIFASLFFMIKGLDEILVKIIELSPYAFYLNSSYFLDGNRKSFLNIATKIIYVPCFLRVLQVKLKISERDRWFLHFGVCCYCIKLIGMASFFLGRFAMYFDVLGYIPLYYYLLFLVGKTKSSRFVMRYARFTELFIFLCICLAPYLMKTIVFPSGEYLYKSIIFN